jgi:hypothetical protein
MSIETVMRVEALPVFRERLSYAMQIEEAALDLGPEVAMHYALDEMAYRLVASLKVPAHEVQNQEIARYPDGAWQALKWAARRWVPWSMKVRFKTIWLREVLLFPQLKLPPNIGRHVVRWAVTER